MTFRKFPHSCGIDEIVPHGGIYSGHLQVVMAWTGHYKSDMYHSCAFLQQTHTEAFLCFADVQSPIYFVWCIVTHHYHRCTIGYWSTFSALLFEEIMSIIQVKRGGVSSNAQRRNSPVSNNTVLTFHLMGLLTDTPYCGLRMRRECRERFPPHRELAIPTCISVRVWRTCRDACRDR